MNDHTSIALVTGASSGIGLELAKLLAADGYGLVLVARNKHAMNKSVAALKKLGAPQVWVVSADLADPKAADRIYQKVTQEIGVPEILINNAGFGGYGEFISTDRQTEREMIAVNVAALTDLAKLFLTGMVKAKRGHIMNVASTAAFQPGPLMAVYFATKAYVLSFSEAIGEELKDTGVTVTALCPGPTATGFEQRATAGKSRLFSGGVMTAETVAAAGYQALKQGQPVIVTGARNKFFTLLVRLLPRSIVTSFVHRAQSPK